MKRSLTKVAVAGGAAFALVRFAAACVDVTPVYVAPREASVIEGAPCLSCLNRPNADLGCADELRVCLDDERCSLVYDCIAERACLEFVLVDDKVACTLPCFEEAEIFTVRDPIVDTLVDVLQCGERGCAVECAISDGGTGFEF